jgi:histone arginine demethylase JMJD6
MGELIDKINCSSATNPAPYLRNNVFRTTFPELVEDIQPLPPYFAPNWLDRNFLLPKLQQIMKRGSEIEIYIGGAGAGFPVLHYDAYHTHAFLMQVYGRKKFYVYAPEQAPFLYTLKDVPSVSAVNDVENPDLAKFPLFAQAVPTVFVLEPGELLFVPSQWWHTTKMLSPSISLSINTVNRTNWDGLCSDLANSRGRLTRLAVALYLKSVFLWNSLEDIFLSQG